MESKQRELARQAVDSFCEGIEALFVHASQLFALASARSHFSGLGAQRFR
jgi:hypothetical protein